MAVKKIDEIMSAINERFKDDTTDETLAFIEDVNDTLSDYDARTKDNTNWEKKYNENDEKWRKRYRDRFFGKSDDEDEDDFDDDDEPKKKLTFSDLFKEI